MKDDKIKLTFGKGVMAYGAIAAAIFCLVQAIRTGNPVWWVAIPLWLNTKIG